MKRKTAGAMLPLLLIAAASTAFGQLGGGGFGGPSVMGRGAPAGQRGGQSVRMRGFASINGVYDSGLTTISQEGVIGRSGAKGTDALWGAYGGLTKRRSSLGLDYQGDYRYYQSAAGFNGLSQTLSLTYAVQPFRRTSFQFSGMAGTTNRAFGATTGLGLAGGLAQVATPAGSFFDIRTNFYGGSGTVTFIHTNRLSTSFSGSGFAVRRRNNLAGVDGVIGRADVAYRLGRRQTLGADVSYYKMDYRGAFGDVNIIDPGLLYSHQIGRQWEFTLRAGVMRVESFGTRTVRFAPEIALLLGVPSTSEIFYLRTFLPSGAVRLTRSFKRGSVDGSYSITPNPGNGLLFASRMNQLSFTGTWSATRKLNLAVTGGQTRMNSVTSLAGSFSQYIYGGGITYKLTRSIEFLSRVDRRVARLNTGPQIGLNGTRVSAGIAFSPSDVPLQLW